MSLNLSLNSLSIMKLISIPLLKLGIDVSQGNEPINKPVFAVNHSVDEQCESKETKNYGMRLNQEFQVF